MQRFPSLPPQIKNHCRIEVVSRQNHAAIPKLTPSNQESMHSSKPVLEAGHSSLQLRKLESDAECRCRDGRSRRNHSSLPLRKLESDAEDRCRDGRSRRAIPHCCDDGAAVIPKFTLSNQESLQCKMRFQAKSCIDSQVWA